MEKIINGRFVAEATGGELISDGGLYASGLSVDSRDVKDGDVFCAIKGERTDGHKYIAMALEKGAHGVICEETPDIPLLEKYGAFAVKVKNTVRAEGLLAAKYKSLMTAKTVGVTGSVGKTTTRTFISSVLEKGWKTCHTDGNFNSDIGLPVSVLKMKKDDEYAVFEMGMGVKGDISYLSGIIKPDIGVITNIGTAHIEFLGSRENIAAAKLEILDGMKNGTLLLNGDEPLLRGVNAGDNRVLYVGLDGKSDLYAENIRYNDGGMLFDIASKCEIPSFKDAFVPAYGNHIVLDGLYAYAAGILSGMEINDVLSGLRSYEGVGNRQKILNIGSHTLMLDYYNASYESICASETVCRELAQKKGGRFLAVIGSVLELGKRSEEIHENIGDITSKLADKYIAVGKEAGFGYGKAVENGMKNAVCFEDENLVDEIANAVFDNLEENDTVLFKASHGIDLGRVADKVVKKLTEGK